VPIVGAPVGVDEVATSDTTTAIIAALAALGGAAVGAAVGGLVTYYLERRREKATAVGAARLVRTDLQTVATHLRVAERDGNWRIYFDLEIKAWDEYRDALATTLESKQWAAVDDAVRVIRALADGVAVFEAKGAPLGPLIALRGSSRASLPEIRDRARKAYDALADLAKEEKADEDFGNAKLGVKT